MYILNHLLYMDDIKLYASTKNQLLNLIKSVEIFSTDIHMDFGIDKCKTVRMEKGKWKHDEDTPLMNNQIITSMQEHETYRYLGIPQHNKIPHKDIKQQLLHKYKTRLTAILNSKLNSRNIFKAINTYAIPILTYSFGIIHWSKTETEELNRLNRTTLTKHRIQHPKSCIERTTLSRSEGGRGLIDITQMHNKQIENLRQYFYSKEDSELHKAIAVADINLTPLNLGEEQPGENFQLIRRNQEEKINNWSQKILHGRFHSIIHEPHISKEFSLTWLIKGELQPETEGFNLAIQDQVIATKNYKKFIIKDTNTQDDRCRKCHQQAETINHITSGCKLLAGTDYTDRHNIAAKIIHQELAIKHNLITQRTPYYKYIPETILEDKTIKLYWDTTLHTDRTISHNRPDITLINKTDRTTYLLDVAIPMECNIERKQQEKIEKYTPLAIEIKDIWRQNKIIILPFILSPTGVTPNGFIENLQRLELPTYVHTNIQKAIILKTCNIVRKFLNPPS